MPHSSDSLFNLPDLAHCKSQFSQILELENLLPQIASSQDKDSQIIADLAAHIHHIYKTQPASLAKAKELYELKQYLGFSLRKHGWSIEKTNDLMLNQVLDILVPQVKLYHHAKDELGTVQVYLEDAKDPVGYFTVGRLRYERAIFFAKFEAYLREHKILLDDFPVYFPEPQNFRVNLLDIQWQPDHLKLNQHSKYASLGNEIIECMGAGIRDANKKILLNENDAFVSWVTGGLCEPLNPWLMDKSNEKDIEKFFTLFLFILLFNARDIKKDGILDWKLNDFEDILEKGKYSNNEEIPSFNMTFVDEYFDCQLKNLDIFQAFMQINEKDIAKWVENNIAYQPEILNLMDNFNGEAESELDLFNSEKLLETEWSTHNNGVSNNETFEFEENESDNESEICWSDVSDTESGNLDESWESVQYRDEGGCLVHIEGDTQKIIDSLFNKEQIAILLSNLAKLKKVIQLFIDNKKPVSLRDFIETFDPIWMDHYNRYKALFDNFENKDFNTSSEEFIAIRTIIANRMGPAALVGSLNKDMSPPSSRTLTPVNRSSSSPVIFKEKLSSLSPAEDSIKSYAFAKHK